MLIKRTKKLRRVEILRKKLRMIKCTFGPSYHSLPPCLHTLNIDVLAGLSTLLDRLLSSPMLPAFKSLRLAVQFETNLVDLESFLQRAGGELECISLHLWNVSLSGIERALVHTKKLRDLDLFVEDASVVPSILSALPLRCTGPSSTLVRLQAHMQSLLHIFANISATEGEQERSVRLRRTNVYTVDFVDLVDLVDAGIDFLDFRQICRLYSAGLGSIYGTLGRHSFISSPNSNLFWRDGTADIRSWGALRLP
ncbi:hypothetical protein DFH09DRAFT_1093118 [Mycena vulgaris]|nr:hypothetical protein DFH09DRAFT_1093118 [Mycena vulgaris]